MADQIVDALNSRKTALEKELKQVTAALNALIPATKDATAVVAKPARRIMSEEAKNKIRAAHLRRHQAQVAESKPETKNDAPSISPPAWKG
jgi:hypothetical protein